MKRHFNGTFCSPFLVDYWPVPKVDGRSLCETALPSSKPLHQQWNEASTTTLGTPWLPTCFPGEAWPLVLAAEGWAPHCRAGQELQANARHPCRRGPPLATTESCQTYLSSKTQSLSELPDSLKEGKSRDRSGRQASAKHFQTFRKVSARLGLRSTQRLLLHHSIQTSLLCLIQPSLKIHLEAFHDYVDISVMLHLNSFGCAESYFLLKYFPF